MIHTRPPWKFLVRKKGVTTPTTGAHEIPPSSATLRSARRVITGLPATR
jgi:hypothetical protein